MENSENRDKPKIKEDTSKRILIYDDNIEILTLCKIILKKSHFEVLTLLKNENVINDVKSFKPNFILMDLWIPEIGGERAVELLKEDPETCHIPVFLFSANTDIREICTRVNAQGYIEKPFNLVTFKNTIENYIQNSPGNFVDRN